MACLHVQQAMEYCNQNPGAQRHAGYLDNPGVFLSPLGKALVLSYMPCLLCSLLLSFSHILP